MQAKQVPILGKHNVLLELVTPDRTEVPEIDGGPDPIDLPAVVRAFGLARVLVGINLPRLMVDPTGDWTGEEYNDNQTDEHFDSEENKAKEEC